MTDALRKRHAILLRDAVRMEAYAAALRTVVRPGDVIADLGCGLGALAFMALRAGAQHVHAIDVEPETLALAMDQATREGLASRITFHQGLAQTVAVPEQVDLIVTETLGSLALDENMLPLLIDARQRWLKPGGRMIPQDVTITFAPIARKFPRHLHAYHHASITDDEYLGTPVSAPMVTFANRRRASWAFQTTLPVARNGILQGFAGWFTLRLTEKVAFSTAPDAPPTHWEQGMLPLRKPQPVRAGDAIDFVIGIEPDPDNLHSIIEYDFLVRPADRNR
ncbi:MAG: methyltransferase domain-containing protein [Deltaproteobacteria bacterium]|nr:methyltransferase domain-containing protein [Deltaproteobacteria bacterium]